MKIEVKSRHAAFSDALRAYAAEQLEAVEHFGLEFSRAEIVLDQGREGLTCEILLYAQRGDALVAKELSHDARAAVDGAVSKLKTQVARAKERRDDRRHAS